MTDLKIHLYEKTYFFINFCIATLSLNAQNSYYDALKLKNLLKDSAKSVVADEWDTIAGILKKYLPGDKIIDTNAKQTVKNFKENNPFFDDFIRESKGVASDDNIPISFGKATVSSLGSLNVTNIADGIAQFLIKRGKEELNVAFFNRLEKFLDSTEECQVLFPQSVGSI